MPRAVSEEPRRKNEEDESQRERLRKKAEKRVDVARRKTRRKTRKRKRLLWGATLWRDDVLFSRRRAIGKEPLVLRLDETLFSTFVVRERPLGFCGASRKVEPGFRRRRREKNRVLFFRVGKA
jgi:hypothetical protein